MEASRKLWDIADDLSEIGALIAEAGGELTPELEARLDAREGAFESKVETTALYVRHCEQLAENAKAEKDRLAAIQKFWETQAAGLKNRYLMSCLVRANVRDVKTSRVRVRIQKSGTPAIQYHGELDALPPEYVRVVPESRVLDKAALTETLRAGGTLPDGVTATYSESVRIS